MFVETELETIIVRTPNKLNRVMINFCQQAVRGAGKYYSFSALEIDTRTCAIYYMDIHTSL